MKIFFLSVTLLLATACSTVTITAKGSSKRSTAPTYSERKPFFLGGLIGEANIDAKAICNGKNIQQIQTKEYFLDGFLNVITLSIYSPRVVQVWCEGGKA